MIAVLIALVFIGIVTAALLRNTGSQAGASIGYGTMATMASTVKSGMVATESYFAKENNTSALDKITQWLNAKGNDTGKVFLSFSDGKSKQPIADGQYFSSRLRNVDKNNGHVSFEIKSSKTAGGKALKTAVVFYDMGESVDIKSSIKYDANNAVYFAGDVSDANNSMEVMGSATFEGNIKFQNTKAIFHGDTYFNKDASFMGNVRFDSTVYFNGNANFQNYNDKNVFGGSVGINGNISRQDTDTIRAGGDVLLKGDFINPTNDRDKLVLSSNSNDNKFYYSNNLKMKTQAACSICDADPKGMCPHDCNHPDTISKRVNGFV